MKNILTIAIAVLISLVGFKYASAETFGGGSEVPLSTLNLSVTYEEVIARNLHLFGR